MSSEESLPSEDHRVSIVIPVYQGERHLRTVLADIMPLLKSQASPAGVRFRVTEVLLVHDCGPDRSDQVIRDLVADHEEVRAVWLSRNFGQHAATLAGMASSGGDWIVTMDEDGQHDPASIGRMLDTALEQRADVVYADPVNEAPHGVIRNVASRSAKRMMRTLSGGVDASKFHSFRLVVGEIGRSVAAYAGPGVYLDVALSWVAGAVATAPVELRDEGDERRSGYSLRSLMSHFWRMVLTGGTRGLRLVSILGAVTAAAGVLLAVALGVRQVVDPVPVQGWTSLAVLTLICAGAILFALGVIAEYVGVAVNMAMGKPLYLIVQDPQEGPRGGLPRR